MGVIEAIKKGFEISAKALRIVAILLVFNLVWFLVSLPFAPAGSLTPGQTPPPMLQLINIIFFLIMIFFAAASLPAIKDFIKEGSLKLKDFVSNGLKYYLRILAILMILLVCMMALLVIISVIMGIAAPLNNAVVTFLAGAASLIIFLAGFCGILFIIISPYIAVSEEKGVIASIKANIAFTKANFSKVLGLALLLGLVITGILFILIIITGLLTALLPAAALQIIMGIAGSCFNSYVSVLVWASIMSFYLGRSSGAAVRKEPTGPPSE